MYDTFPTAPEPAPKQYRVPWGLKQMGLCIVVVLVTLFVVTTAIVLPFIEAFGEDAPETLTANSVANLIWNAVMVSAVFFFVRRGGGSAKDLGFVLPQGSNPILRIAGMAALTFLAMYIIVALYGVAIDAFGFDFLEPDQQVPDEFYDSDAALAVLGIAIVLGAPIAEETLFRGFLFGGTRPIIGTLLAAVITGFIFSLAHYNPGLVIPFTLIGAVLCLSYHRTGSLFVPIGAHFLFNLVSFSVLVFVPEARPD